MKGFVRHTVNVIVLDVIQGDSPDEFIVIVSRKKAETILAEFITSFQTMKKGGMRFFTTINNWRIYFEKLNWLDQLEPSNEAEWLVSELKQGGNVDQNYLFLNLISKNLRYFIYQIKNETFVMESIGLMLFTRKINV